MYGSNWQIELDGKRLSYLSVLRFFDIEKMEYMGRPMSEGGSPQVQALVSILTSKGFECKAFYNGSQLF